MPTGVIVNSANSPYFIVSGQTDTNDVVVSGGTLVHRFHETNHMGGIHFS